MSNQIIDRSMPALIAARSALFLALQSSWHDFVSQPVAFAKALSNDAF
jgi:hypothetical protein